MRNKALTTELGWDRESQVRRAGHRENSANLLTANMLPFESKNYGAHLIVSLVDRKVDFWPGTGKWIDRKTKHEGRGVFNLIKRAKRLYDQHKSDLTAG